MSKLFGGVSLPARQMARRRVAGVPVARYAILCRRLSGFFLLHGMITTFTKRVRGSNEQGKNEIALASQWHLSGALGTAKLSRVGTAHADCRKQKIRGPCPPCAADSRLMQVCSVLRYQPQRGATRQPRLAEAEHTCAAGWSASAGLGAGAVSYPKAQWADTRRTRRTEEGHRQIGYRPVGNSPMQKLSRPTLQKAPVRGSWRQKATAY